MADRDVIYVQDTDSEDDVMDVAPRVIIDLTADDDVIDLTADDDVIEEEDDVVEIVAGDIRAQARRRGLSNMTAAELETVVIDLTMEDEDEAVPEGFWKEVIEAKSSMLQPKNIEKAICTTSASHTQGWMVMNAPVTRENLQQLMVPQRVCYYAFTDNIEYRHIVEEAPQGDIQEETYEEDAWPPGPAYHALFTLDCFEASYFLQMLMHHARTFEMLFGSTLTQEKIDARNALLGHLLAQPSKSWIIRILVGSEHHKYREYHQLFKELTWTKIWIPPPPGKFGRSLWTELEAKASDAHDVYIAPDLFTESVADFELTPDTTITAQEIAYLEEVFSLNHIPDASLPPAAPVSGVPTEPLNGFQFQTNFDPYWGGELPDELSSSVAGGKIVTTDTGIAVNETTSERFRIHYLKKNFLVLQGESGAFHTCLFLNDRMEVRRAFPFGDYVKNQHWRNRLRPGVIEAGSLLSDERIFYIVDLVSGARFIGLHLSESLGYFFVAVEYAAYLKKQPS